MNTVAANFESFELDHSLFDIRIDGVPVWERLRLPVFKQIKQQNGRGVAHGDNTTAWRQYSKGAGLFLRNLVRNNPYFAGEHDILYLGTRRRKQREDGYWWDLYCDPVHEACDYDYVHFEEPYFLTHRRPARTKNLRYLDLITVGRELQQLLGFNEPTIPAPERQQLETAHDEIRERFDASINLLSMAHAELYDRRTTLPFYRRLIDQVDPELVVIIASYGRETFIEVCQQQDVPVVELQHGVIYPNHFGYAYPSPRTKETFPDYLLTFGEFWTDAAEFPIPKERVIPVGYPYLEQAAHTYDDVETTDRLLFISQGTIGKQLSKFAVAVNQHPEISSEVVYKLHPGEYDRWRSEYPWLVDTDIEVIDTSEPALYRLFAEASGQIGVYSTALYEGLQFGLETYLYDCEEGETLQRLLDDGVATLVSSVDQLVSALDNDSKEFDREQYFATDATSRICETLGEIRTDSLE
ncbi:hypothetical protein [Halorubrum pallidum]|uniref:Uncharacterized protein n=1 Tax=Halorubrum pallidum TaxID=1526114 RepID=A0ABD5T5Z0_9EURY